MWGTSLRCDFARWEGCGERLSWRLVPRSCCCNMPGVGVVGLFNMLVF